MANHVTLSPWSCRVPVYRSSYPPESTPQLWSHLHEPSATDSVPVFSVDMLSGSISSASRSPFVKPAINSALSPKPSSPPAKEVRDSALEPSEAGDLGFDGPADAVAGLLAAAALFELSLSLRLRSTVADGLVAAEVFASGWSGAWWWLLLRDHQR